MTGNTVDGPFQHLTVVEAAMMGDEERAGIAQAAASILLANHPELRNSPRGLADNVEELTGIDSDNALWMAPAEIFPRAA